MIRILIALLIVAASLAPVGALAKGGHGGGSAHWVAHGHP